MDLTVERNGYGRQIDSHVAEIAPAPEFRAEDASRKP